MINQIDYIEFDFLPLFFLPIYNQETFYMLSKDNLKHVNTLYCGQHKVPILGKIWIGDIHFNNSHSENHREVVR